MPDFTAPPIQQSVWKLIRSDLDRFRIVDQQPYFAMPFTCPACLACVTYRIGHAIWSYCGAFSAIIPLLKVLYILFSQFSRVITGIWIAPQAEIGRGLYIGHYGPITVGSASMGANCTLSQGVTIGQASRGQYKGLPIIGDRVYIAPGAKLIGRINIGNDVAIGANTVVARSLPDRAVAVGVSAEIISFAGSFDYILYDGMESDLSRLESLALGQPSTDDLWEMGI